MIREDVFNRTRVALFFAAIVFCVTPLATPPIALAIGIAFALTVGHPFPDRNARATKVLLQLSIIGLGFGMNLAQVVAAGRTGLLFTVATIAGTLILGFLAGRLLRVQRATAHLISSGTAICGGSAIAAVGPVLGATDDEMSVSLGTVFILNAVALFLFPRVGTELGLTQSEFGMWSAIAIHDTSSVVGAAARYGWEALQVATPVKLARALWIVPLTLATAMLFHKRTRVAVPWFIVLFVVASIVRTYVAAPPAVWATITYTARLGLTVTLFLIGAGLSRKALAAVGVRPLVLGIVLWVAISVVSLYVVRAAL
jgi:uncharacterized integral membrane protein (TIGR00698 family)